MHTSPLSAYVTCRRGIKSTLSIASFVAYAVIYSLGFRSNDMQDMGSAQFEKDLASPT